MSEIDAIFASKAAPPPPPSPPPTKPAKKKSKKKKTAPQPSPPPPPSSSKKRPPPETVVDTSHKRIKSSQPQPNPDKKSTKTDKKALDGFKDSRGTASRRTTEEGWLVYKEDELGIGDTGGGKLQHSPLSI
ncbi:hypothetical protein JR316_0000851 [Psilocybe cubensis]|uniref:Uncharacterized protein n=2 Tax=Psilocybe cubensis TaxID=181762 RepID=A0ACB8HFR1_PSICU|nr:hypothetical protein JR316_0000851 [Psilocybe cubensis]KAH9486786.1 hypothetical protein JR316_0000851 [Psilocybe cubensis]